MESTADGEYFLADGLPNGDELCVKGFLWESVICYIDDIIVYSEAFDEHLRTLEKVSIPPEGTEVLGTYCVS